MDSEHSAGPSAEPEAAIDLTFSPQGRHPGLAVEAFDRAELVAPGRLRARGSSRRVLAGDTFDDGPETRSRGSGLSAARCRFLSLFVGLVVVLAACSDDEGSAYDFSEVSATVADFVEVEGLNGAGLVVVRREEGVIHHEHWGEFDEDRVSLIASSSKMITAGVLLRLDDDGLLDIDAPIADVVEWGAGNPDVTTVQLISNSSGLVGVLPNPGYVPYGCQFDEAWDLQSCAERIFTTPDDDADIVPPDVEFRYGGAQWQVAGAVAEIASGKTWAELIDDIYVEPCGLEALAYNNHFGQIRGGSRYPTMVDGDPSVLRATENPNVEAGAYVTTGDYGALLLMHLRDGRCGDEQVLSPEAIDRMHRDRIAAVYDGDAWSADNGYGMGWWIDRDTGRISDGGAYGSEPWLDLEDGYGVYLVLEANADLGIRLADELHGLIEAAVTGSPD